MSLVILARSGEPEKRAESRWIATVQYRATRLRSASVEERHPHFGGAVLEEGLCLRLAQGHFYEYSTRQLQTLTRTSGSATTQPRSERGMLAVNGPYVSGWR